MNTHYYYCLISEVKPEHYPMIFEVAGKVLSENAIVNLERNLTYVYIEGTWDFFFIEPHDKETLDSRWNFGTELYVKETNAIYLFNPSLSVEEVLFLHSLET